jgi:hypothetical protein
LRWRLLTNVTKIMATVSPTGKPIKSSDVKLLWIKHCRHIPPGGEGLVDDGGAGAMVRAWEAVTVCPAASVTVSVVMYVPAFWYA